MSECLTTFELGGELFGIDVLRVQEVAVCPSIVQVPLAPRFVLGLSNLRGQIATAIGLAELFGRPGSPSRGQMSIVCSLEGCLISLLVDRIGDVIDVDRSEFEGPPETLPEGTKKYIKGIYKLNGALLSVLDLDAIARDLSPAAEVAVDTRGENFT